MLFADLLSLHLVTFLMFFILVYIYIQHLLPSLAVIHDSMPRAKVLGNKFSIRLYS